jgi:Glycosyltransferases involved in cell wall biogenesis
MKEIMVSICCITYNHEKYIADAIESFLMQRTDFPYEIILHDDASTDSTADIIRRYESKYPNRIKGIYQEENQYSQKINIFKEYLFPRANGKYIALCEGDDYWIDRNKLQLQVNYMQCNPYCSLCFHAAKVVSKDQKSLSSLRPYLYNTLCDTKMVILKKSNYPTASLLFPSRLVKKMPDFYINSPVGDAPLHLFLVHQGYAYYMDRFMSAYRTVVDFSWSAGMREGNVIKNTQIFRKQIILMYLQFDVFTQGKYTEAIRVIIDKINFFILLDDKRYQIIKSQKYKKYYKELTAKQRIHYFLDRFCPGVYFHIRKLRAKLKHN